MARGGHTGRNVVIGLLAVAVCVGQAGALGPGRAPRALSYTQQAAVPALSVSLYHACVTMTNGHGICWGYATSSQLHFGAGSGTSSTLARLTSRVPACVLATPASTFASIHQPGRVQTASGLLLRR